MTNPIHELLQSLGTALEMHLKAANDVAETAQAELAQLKLGLLALAGQTPTRDDPRVRITSERAQRGLRVKIPRSSRRCSVPDDTLLDVLSHEWATAAQVRQSLLERGASIAEGTTYNRMRKLAADLPETVDASSKPERWRLKSKLPQPQNERPPHSKAARCKPRLLADPAAIPATLTDGIVPILKQGNCLDVMKDIEAGSVDLILADLPYGTTRSEGDIELPLDRLWEHYRRILKPTGTVVLFASQPFTTKLAASNFEWLKYALVWEKNQPSGFLHAKNKPLKSHEDILVFSPGTTIHASRSKRRMTYNPQGAICVGLKSVKKQGSMRYMGGARHYPGKQFSALTNCPRSILTFPKDARHLHPFQKPLALLEYLIKMYSNEGDVVLDNTMGSGSTCIAAMRSGRRSIGIEQKQEWFDIANQRVSSECFHPINDNGAAHKVPISGRLLSSPSSKLQT